MRTPRLWRHFRARLGGYFWTPCPLCHEPFSGHEEAGRLGSRLICRPCALERQCASEEFVWLGVVALQSERAFHDFRASPWCPDEVRKDVGTIVGS